MDSFMVSLIHNTFDLIIIGHIYRFNFFAIQLQTRRLFCVSYRSDECIPARA